MLENHNELPPPQKHTHTHTQKGGKRKKKLREDMERVCRITL